MGNLFAPIYILTLTSPIISTATESLGRALVD